PEADLAGFLTAAGHSTSEEEAEWAAIELRYAGYMEREREAADHLNELEDFEIPADLELTGVASLSYEAREKLTRHRPLSLGAAGRISGISPSDLQNLVLEVIKHRRKCVVSRETGGLGVRD
ncbi:MAG TPA: hypothetical protein VGP61_04975, partial [Gemmatimonadales bacterium]|nr:hypothetical protein [Gemmatimonadales bacterium]